MAITDWPPNERPREKLLLHGSAALSDAELLAIFLRTGVHGKTAVDLSRELLVAFGSLRALLTADFNQFTQHLGLGPAKFAHLQAVLEMSRRHLSEPLPQRHLLNNPQATREFLQVQLRDYQHEVFAGLFLDTRHRVICFKELFHGTLSSASVYPREVLKIALKYNAAAVIFAHNHPSGIADPSIADEQITIRLKDALALVDIQLLDHIVVGDNSSVSFAERGLI